MRPNRWYRSSAGLFAPYVAGDTFSIADIMFLYSADLAALVGKNLWGLDLLGELPLARELLQRRHAVRPGVSSNRIRA